MTRKEALEHAKMLKEAKWKQEWHNLCDNEIFWGYQCSNCGCRAKPRDDVLYPKYLLPDRCPNCKALMVEVEK